MNKFVLIGLVLSSIGCVLLFCTYFFVFAIDIFFINWGQKVFFMVVWFWSSGQITEVPIPALLLSIYAIYTIPVTSVFTININLFMLIIFIFIISGLIMLLISKSIKSDLALSIK
jgi:hypothetical protein